MSRQWELKQYGFCFAADNIIFPRNHLKKRMISSTCGPVVTRVKLDSGENLKLIRGKLDLAWQSVLHVTVCHSRDVTNMQFIPRADSPVAVWRWRPTKLNQFNRCPHAARAQNKTRFPSIENYCYKMGFKFMLKPLFPVGSASSSAPQTALKNKKGCIYRKFDWKARSRCTFWLVLYNFMKAL